MGAVKALLQEARSLLRKPKSHTKAVSHDRFDEMIWREALEAAPNLRDFVEEVDQRFPYAPELVQDVFNLFWQGDPRLHDTAEMHPKCVPHRTAIDALKQLPDVAKIRQHSIGDQFSAILGALSVGSQIVDLIEKHPTPDTDAKEQQLQEALEALEHAAASGDAGATSTAMAQAEQATSEWEQAIADATQASEQLTQQINAVTYEKGKKGKSGVAGAAERMAEAVAAEADGLASWGLDEPTLRKLSYNDRHRLLTFLRREDTRKFSRLLGRFRFRATADQARKSEYGRDEVYSLMLSDELAEVVGSELAQLSMPRLRSEFMRRLAEKELLTRKWRGKQKVGEGPLVVIVDESSSMNRGRIDWAKAFALTLMQIAFKSKRPFVAISFSTKAIKWDLSPTDPMACLDFLESFMCGGTLYAPPLALAKEAIESDELMRRADLVFITDGEANDKTTDWIESFRDWRQQRGVRVWGVAIAHNATPALEQISDTTRSIYDFADVEQVSDLLRSV